MQRQTAQGKLERRVARPREGWKQHRREREAEGCWRSDGKTREAAVGWSRPAVLVVAVLMFLPPARVPPRACHPIKLGSHPRPWQEQSRPCHLCSVNPTPTFTAATSYQ
jgi:hypothetical protein